MQKFLFLLSLAFFDCRSVEECEVVRDYLCGGN